MRRGIARTDIRAVLASTLIAVLIIGCSKRAEEAAPPAATAEPQAMTAPEVTEVSVRFPIPIIESGQTPFYLAQDLGYYRDQGLDVRFEMGSRELNPVKLVVAGQDAFGILGGPDTLLVARSRGQLVKAIAILHRNSNFPCLVTLARSRITQPAQLEGKKVGFFYGHISTDVLRNLLRRQSVHYTEVDVGFDYGQLISGTIDAQWAFTVTAGLDLPARGIQLNFISPADYGIVTHGYTIFAAEETIQDRPDEVLRFLRATLRGVDQAVKHPADANAALLKRDPKLDPELNLRRQKAYNAVTSDSDEFPPGYMDRSMFQSSYDRLVEEKVIERPFPVEEAYTTQFLEELHGKKFD